MASLAPRCHRFCVNHAEFTEFNYVELIYHKVGQSLSQTGTIITMWGRYYKVGQELLQSRSALCYYKVEQELLKSR